jgi:hypothetical protein
MKRLPSGQGTRHLPLSAMAETPLFGSDTKVPGALSRSLKECQSVPGNAPAACTASAAPMHASAVRKRGRFSGIG